MLLAGLFLAPTSHAHPVDIEYGPHGPTVDDHVQFFNLTHHPDTSVTYQWVFSDGTTHNGRVPFRQFPAAGDYWVNLTITHADGTRESDNLTLAILPARAPIFPIPSWLAVAMPIMVAFLLVSLSLLVIVRGQPNIYNRVFFAFYMLSATKSVTDGLYRFFRDTPGSVGLDVAVLVNQIAGYLFLTMFFWFVLVFPRPVWGWLKSGGKGMFLLLLAVPFLLNGVLYVLPTILFNVYAAVMGLVALGLLVYHAWETDSAEERHRIQLLSATFFILVFSTIAVTGIQILGQGAFANGDRVAGWYYTRMAEDFGLVIAPILEVVGCFVLMYAILRYQLMGVDVIVKRITRGALFAIMMGTTFVTVGNTIEFFLEEKLFQGQVPLGFLVAGFVAAIAMLPIQKATEKIANRIFPHAGSTAPDIVSQRRMEIYEAQLRYALLDGTLKQKELSMLTSLRDSLQLKPEELRKVASLFPAVSVDLLLSRPVAPGQTPTF